MVDFENIIIYNSSILIVYIGVFMINSETGSENVTSQEQKEKENNSPRKYKIIFHNDDFTPFPVVENILMFIYNKTKEEAYSIAAKVHNEGQTVVGVYSQSLAQIKYKMSQEFIKEHDLTLYIQILPE